MLFLDYLRNNIYIEVILISDRYFSSLAANVYRITHSPTLNVLDLNQKRHNLFLAAHFPLIA